MVGLGGVALVVVAIAVLLIAVGVAAYVDVTQASYAACHRGPGEWIRCVGSNLVRILNLPVGPPRQSGVTP